MPCSTLKGLTIVIPCNPVQNMTPPPPCCFLIWLPDDFPFSSHPSGPSKVTQHSYVQRTLVKSCFVYLTAQSIRFWRCNLVRGGEVTTYLTFPIFRRQIYWVVSGTSGILASLKIALLVARGVFNLRKFQFPNWMVSWFKFWGFHPDETTFSMNFLILRWSRFNFFCNEACWLAVWYHLFNSLSFILA